jgi:hypothetical protein
VVSTATPTDVSSGATPQPATPTAEEAPTRAAPTETTGAPSATQPSTSATEPSTGSQSLVGDVAIEDPTGDVINMFDETPLAGEIPGADLVSIRVVGDGSALTASFVASTPFSELSTDSSSEWYLDIHTGSQLTDEIKLVFTSGDWTVTYFDFRTGSFSGTDLDVEPVIDGTTLTVTIPTEQLSGVVAPFAWSGTSMITDDNGTWADAVPDEATGMFYDVEELPQFP